MIVLFGRAGNNCALQGRVRVKRVQSSFWLTFYFGIESIGSKFQSDSLIVRRLRMNVKIINCIRMCRKRGSGREIDQSAGKGTEVRTSTSAVIHARALYVTLEGSWYVIKQLFIWCTLYAGPCNSLITQHAAACRCMFVTQGPKFL